MKKCLFPIDAYVVWCPTWSKNLLRSLVMHQFLCQQSIAVCNHAAGLVIIPNNWLQPWCSNTSSGWSVRDLYLCCHFKGFDELMKAWESCLKHMVPLRILNLIKIIRFTKSVKQNSYIWNACFINKITLAYVCKNIFGVRCIKL